MDKVQDLKFIIYRMFDSMPNIKVLPPEWQNFLSTARIMRRKLGDIELKEMKESKIPQYF
jgi:hypothetical protein